LFILWIVYLFIYTSLPTIGTGGYNRSVSFKTASRYRSSLICSVVKSGLLSGRVEGDEPVILSISATHLSQISGFVPNAYNAHDTKTAVVL